MTPASAELPDSLRIGFIGAGRLAKAVAWSLSHAGLHVARVASAIPADAQVLAARIPRCEAVAAAQQVVDGCDLVFLAVPDEAIEPATEQLRWREGVAVVHCSGVTEVDALRWARSQGAQVGGFHPMQTFGDPLAAVASLPGSTITVEAPEPLHGWLVALATRLGCRVNRLPPGMRARYHAAAGYTSQFINALFAEAAAIWQSWGATEEDALRALMPLARGTLASIESAGIAGGMPGPVSRGDLASIEKHVRALAGLGEDKLAFYRTLCGSTIPLGVARGAIDERQAQRWRQVLGRAGPGND